MSEKRCETCNWFFYDGDVVFPTFECHINPPTIVQVVNEDGIKGGRTAWPKTELNNKCSKWISYINDKNSKWDTGE